MNKFFAWLFHPPTDGHWAIVFIRFMTGVVFFSEGLIKFIFANQGVGRFTKIGFPYPNMTAEFVGGLEIIGGLCLIIGLFTRFFSVLFVIQMIVAILSTKIALFLGTSPLPPPVAPPVIGFWAVMHETRSDWAQLLSSIFLALVGPGIGLWIILYAEKNKRRRKPFSQLFKSEPCYLMKGPNPKVLLAINVVPYRISDAIRSRGA